MCASVCLLSALCTLCRGGGASRMDENKAMIELAWLPTIAQVCPPPPPPSPSQRLPTCTPPPALTVPAHLRPPSLSPPSACPPA